jgi:hypothetical protein
MGNPTERNKEMAGRFIMTWVLIWIGITVISSMFGTEVFLCGAGMGWMVGIGIAHLIFQPDPPQPEKKTPPRNRYGNDNHPSGPIGRGGSSNGE